MDGQKANNGRTKVGFLKWDTEGQNAVFCVKCVKKRGYRWGILPPFFKILESKSAINRDFWGLLYTVRGVGHSHPGTHKG